MDAIKIEKKYTYADYVKWDDDARYKLIEGVPYMMSSPNYDHQSISMELAYQIRSFLSDKSCKVLSAPFDIRLNAVKKDDTVVQPDIVVICDRSKITKSSCVGAPDMVIEIISPSTSQFDRLIKFQQYLKHGVREYWIVDPESRTATVHILRKKTYVTNVYGDNDSAPVHVLEGLIINLSAVFNAAV